DRTVSDKSKSPVPRGKIFDRDGDVLVDNDPLYSITYTPPKRAQPEDKLELAEKLIKYMEVDEEEIDKVTEKNKEEYWYMKNLDRTVSDKSKSPVPRGKIFDRDGDVLVDNDPLYSITYTPPKRAQPEDKLELAEKLIKYMEVDEEEIDKVTEKNKEEYWYMKN